MAKLFEASVLQNEFIPHTPSMQQAWFLMLDAKDAFYGGAAGGGKSDALLMAALQYVGVPGYAAIIFRRTFADLELPEALIDRANEWLAGTGAHYDGQKHRWTFPSGATLSFGYLDGPRDKFRYQSAAFHFAGFDEVTQIREGDFRYLFSRIRRLEGHPVPVRVRSAANPGGLSHEFIKRRYVKPGDPLRPFVPAKLSDNPHLDQAQYIESLAELDPVTRAQLLDGDWNVSPDGVMFDRGWFEIVSDWPRDAEEVVRGWDRAATKKTKRGKDPDWTVGAKTAMKDGQVWIVDVARFRDTPKGNRDRMKQTAILDGRECAVGLEQEPGSSGVDVIDVYRREVLFGFDVRVVKPNVDKTIRARPVASAAEAGNVKLVDGPWVQEYLDEIEAFPVGAHDDQVDATSLAFKMLGLSNVRPHAVALAGGEDDGSAAINGVDDEIRDLYDGLTGEDRLAAFELMKAEGML